MLMNRRTLLASACATAACSPATAVIGPSPAGSLIDVHTHVFNAADLSVQKFVSIVVCKNFTEASSDCGPGAGYGRALGDLAVSISNLFAPSAHYELRKLVPSSADAGVPTQHDTEELEKLDLADNELRDAESERKFRDALADYLSDQRTHGSSADDPLSSRNQLLSQIDAETSLRSPHSPSADSGVPSTPPQTEREKVDRLMDSVDGELARYIKWIRLLCRSRNRVVDAYKAAYRDHAPTISNFVSLLVDYEKWLDDSPKSSFPDQIDVMAALKTKYPGMISFAPYCPLRQALAVQAHAQSTHSSAYLPLDDLKLRWLTQGFTPQPGYPAPPQSKISGKSIDGIKLYPPMGFRPIDNAGLSDNDFPPRVLNQWRAVGGRPGQLGAALDEAMIQLFTWAQQEGVPIMTHSGNSVDAGCHFAERGGPNQWAKVLGGATLANNRTIAGFGDLRLCLGHFDDPLPFAHNDSGSWGRQKGALLERYPNVYTDLSYIEEIVYPQHADEVRQFFDALKGWAEANNGRIGKKLLYGSDWIMFDREANNGSYYGLIQQQMQRVRLSPELINDFAVENARRFLRLTAG
jgi:hypothetical protein